jgi:hypothetical protein
MLRTLALLLFVLQPLCSAPSRPDAQRVDDATAKLNQHVSNYNPGVYNFVGALVRVSNDFKVPMGISWINSPATRAERPFAWKHATVREIILAIVGTQPGYQVQLRDGVVRVSAPIPGDQNFLRMRIARFDVRDQYAELAYFRLWALVTPGRRVNREVSIAGPGDSRVTVALKDCTVEDALDALTLASNKKIWIVTFLEDGRLIQRGLRPTASLWSRKLTGADEIGWDAMRWGDPVPPLLAPN